MRFWFALIALGGILGWGGVAPALAAPCLKITLTGTMGGPPTFNGLAGPGTLVSYGDDSNDCSDVLLQFDAGRGTNVQLSALGLIPARLHAIFFTHLHSDHTDGLADLPQHRWHFNSTGPQLDVVCSEDAVAPAGHTMSCQNLVDHIGDAYIESGEIDQRILENPARLAGGPAELANVVDFLPGEPAAEIWSSGDVSVSAIRSTHIPGHASYRVDTPAGSVVIGGDAGNDVQGPPFPPARPYSTSDQVEALANGADVIVHSTIHPVMESSFPSPIFFRQSTATDIGAMAKRAGVSHVMLTHLIPPLGAEAQGPFPVPGGALKKKDYKKAVKDGGFKGKIHVGTDLMTLRIPKKNDNDEDSDSDG